MDPSVDKMKLKLTKYGFGLNLLGSSSFLSVLGIVVSIIGVIVSIVCFVMGGIAGSAGGTTMPAPASVMLYITGTVILIIMIPYLIMWVRLKIKTSKKDIDGIERIGEIYSHVSGSLEIFAMFAQIISSSVALKQLMLRKGTYSDSNIVYIIGAAIYLVFACLKIHGVRVENNKLVGTYLGFRYGLFVLNVIAFSIIWSKSRIFNFYVIGIGIYFITYFILDIGLTVILHSIRVNRGNTARAENEMKDF